MFLGRTVFEKNAMLTCKIQSCRIVLTLNFLQFSITSFEYCATEKHQIFLYKVYKKVNIYTKFHVPWSQSIREKRDANLQKFKVAELF